MLARDKVSIVVVIAANIVVIILFSVCHFIQLANGETHSGSEEVTSASHFECYCMTTTLSYTVVVYDNVKIIAIIATPSKTIFVHFCPGNYSGCNYC